MTVRDSWQTGTSKKDSKAVRGNTAKFVHKRQFNNVEFDFNNQPKNGPFDFTQNSGASNVRSFNRVTAGLNNSNNGNSIIGRNKSKDNFTTFNGSNNNGIKSSNRFHTLIEHDISESESNSESGDSDSGASKPTRKKRSLGNIIIIV